MLRATIYGLPQPQGSMKAFTPPGHRFPVVTADNEKLKPWRQEVAQTALAEMKRTGATMIKRPCGVMLQVAFFFDRPKSTKDGAAKTTKPDLDKLVRGLLDALTGIAFEDDAQVLQCFSTKSYSSPARTEIFVSHQGFATTAEQRTAGAGGGQTNP